jgi:hypothetical protein
MTALINTLTGSPLDETGPGRLLNVIAILALLGMLLAQEFARIGGTSRAQRLIQVLNTAVYSLLVVSGLILVLRLGLIIVQHANPGS